jgi:hypothetical protein
VALRAELKSRCEEMLRARWENALARLAARPAVPQRLLKAIIASVNSSTKTYRYVLPTQLLAKVADPSLDCRCLQVARGGAGAFDARSLCHTVIVPFDREHENVLGGSSEPYANNPVRVPEVTRAHRGPQRDKAGWDDLCAVLAAVEQRDDPAFTADVFDTVLTAIRDRLEKTAVSYALPQRIAHGALLSLLRAYLAEPSGGLRLQAVVSALFGVIGARFSLFPDVRSRKPTASDASTKQVADVECYDKDGRLALAVEVKDRELTVAQISGKLPAVRAAQLTELLFIVERGIRAEDSAETDRVIGRQFAGGHSIYVFPLLDFASGILALFGEGGRREFLEAVGQVLDEYQAPVSDRRAWSALLRDL